MRLSFEEYRLWWLISASDWRSLTEELPAALWRPRSKTDGDTGASVLWLVSLWDNGDDSSDTCDDKGGPPRRVCGLAWKVTREMGEGGCTERAPATARDVGAGSSLSLRLYSWVRSVLEETTEPREVSLNEAPCIDDDVEFDELFSDMESPSSTCPVPFKAAL